MSCFLLFQLAQSNIIKYNKDPKSGKNIFGDKTIAKRPGNKGCFFSLKFSFNQYPWLKHVILLQSFYCILNLSLSKKYNFMYVSWRTWNIIDQILLKSADFVILKWKLCLWKKKTAIKSWHWWNLIWQYQDAFLAVLKKSLNSITNVFFLWNENYLSMKYQRQRCTWLLFIDTPLILWGHFCLIS